MKKNISKLGYVIGKHSDIISSAALGGASYKELLKLAEREKKINLKLKCAARDYVKNSLAKLLEDYHSKVAVRKCVTHKQGVHIARLLQSGYGARDMEK